MKRRRCRALNCAFAVSLERDGSVVGRSLGEDPRRQLHRHAHGRGLRGEARDQWGQQNGEDVSELAYEGCELTSPKRLGCEFGNETNEEQLQMDFEIVDGKIGKMIHADRTSDFH